MKNTTDQTTFWEAMKEKYERRNDELRKQETRLRQRLEDLKKIMEQSQNECDCVPEKLESQKPSIVQSLMENARQLILGSCKCNGRIEKNGDDKILCACDIDLDQPNETKTSCLTENAYQCGIDQKKAIQSCLEPKGSTYSLSSADVYYMEKLKDLVKHEKEMKDQIQNLRTKEKNYLCTIQEKDKLQSRPQSKKCGDARPSEIEELRDENIKLKNEIEDLKIELKHCLERVEGPLRHTLANERQKSTKLQHEIDNLEQCMCIQKENHLKEINAIKTELCTACCTLVDLSNANARLKSDLQLMENKCKDLEEELLKQKLREAESILKFKNAITQKSESTCQECNQELGSIAKKLSNSLRVAFPCIGAISPELAECVNSIKNLAYLIGEKKQHAVNKNQQASCSCTSSIKNPQRNLSIQTSSKQSRYKSVKIQKEDAYCSCSDAAPDPPKIMLKVKEKACNVGSFRTQKQQKKSISCTCSLETIEKNDSPIECACGTSKKSCEIQAEILSADTCKFNDPPCKPLENRRTGPSEEFIAERTFYCVVPSNYARTDNACGCSNDTIPIALHTTRSTKINVDTKVDLIDKTPEDIHVLTTVTPSGTLEVVTEGPPGMIETKVTYLDNGKIEIYTQLINHDGDVTKLLGGTFSTVPALGQGNVDDCTCNASPNEYGKDLVAMQENQIFDFNTLIPIQQMLKAYNLHKIQHINVEESMKIEKNDLKLPLEAQLLIKNQRCHFRIETINILKDLNVAEKIEQKAGDSNISDINVSENISDIVSSLIEDIINVISNINEIATSNDTSTLLEDLEMNKTFTTEIENNEIKPQTTDMSFQRNINKDQTKASEDDKLIPPPESSLPPNESSSSDKPLTSEDNEYDTSSDSDEYNRINRNLGMTNLLEERDVRASKSMIDHHKKLPEDSLVRPCKSELIISGVDEDVPITLDTLEFISEGPYEGHRNEENSLVRTWRMLRNRRNLVEPISTDDLEKYILKERYCDNVNEENENKNNLNSQIPKSVTYQCYVCRCGQAKKKESKKPIESTNLERRIDHLLEHSPLSSHGPDCQCVDCLFYNTARNVPCDNAQCSCETCSCVPSAMPAKKAKSCVCQKSTNKSELKNDPCQCDQPCPCVPCSRPLRPKACNCPIKTGQKNNLFDENRCPCDQPCSCVPCARENPKKKCDHGLNCTCVDCLCNPEKIKPVLPPILIPAKLPQKKADKFKAKQRIPKKVACDCASCNCGWCTDPTKNPMATEIKKETPKIEFGIKEEKCNCKTCQCVLCSGADNDKVNENDIKIQEQQSLPQNDDLKLLDVASTAPAIKGCTNETCANTEQCQSSQDSDYLVPVNNPDTWQNTYVPSRAAKLTKDDCACIRCPCVPCPKNVSKESDSPKTMAESTYQKENEKNIFNCFRSICQEFFELNNEKNACNCDPYCKCPSCMHQNKRRVIGASVGEGDMPYINDQIVSNTVAPQVTQILPCLIDRLSTQNQLICKCDSIVLEENVEELKSDNNSTETIDFVKECVNIEQIAEFSVPCVCSDDVSNQAKQSPDCSLCDNRAEEIVEINNVLEEIRITCENAEIRAKPLMKPASKYESTISQMQLTLVNLQEKCKDKDRIIDAMTKELSARSESGMFSDLLRNLARPDRQKNLPDFTRGFVIDRLPRPSFSIIKQKKRNYHNRLEPILENINDNHCTCAVVHPNVYGLEIIDIRRVTVNSILIKWNHPSNISNVSGYKIFINDRLMYKVLSPTRNNAVIDALDLTQSLEVMLFAVSASGLCEPPALATYKI